MKRLSPLILVVGALAAACTAPNWEPATPNAPATPPAQEPARLIDTVVADPDFKFEAWRDVTLELNLTAPEQRGATRVEILDASGETLFVGVVKELVTEVRLPVSRADRHLTVLEGPEGKARALQIDLDAPRIAVAL